jgi:hypothetical protein
VVFNSAMRDQETPPSTSALKQEEGRLMLALVVLRSICQKVAVLYVRLSWFDMANDASGSRTKARPRHEIRGRNSSEQQNGQLESARHEA